MPSRAENIRCRVAADLERLERIFLEIEDSVVPTPGEKFSSGAGAGSRKGISLRKLATVVFPHWRGDPDTEAAAKVTSDRWEKFLAATTPEIRDEILARLLCHLSYTRAVSILESMLAEIPDGDAAD